MSSDTGTGTTIENAAPGEIPGILADPPWEQAARRPKPAKPKEPEARVVDGLEPPPGLAVSWAPGQREKWAATKLYLSSSNDLDRLIDEYVADQRSMYPPTEASMFAGGPEDRIRPLLAEWRVRYVTPSFFRYLKPTVARYELEARDAMLHCAGIDAPAAGSALLPYLDAEVALLMADWMFRLKTAQDFTQAYFRQHGLDAVPFLVPDAVGKRRPPRRKATAALALVAEEHGLDAVVKAARVHGDEAADIVAEALSAGAPVADVQKKPAEGPPKPPKLPWLDVAALPRPVLRGSGRALPPAATANLVSLLALSSGDEPYEGLAEVFELCKPGSLAALAWAVFEAWRAAREPSRNGWVLAQLAWLGDDETVRRLTPVIRVWPGRSGHAKAVRGLEVLTAIGTDTALIHLDGIARKVKFTGLREAARRAIAGVAKARGLTSEQLADRLVPDFGLDAEGGLHLAYGPRGFRVAFDEQLRPLVTDDSGKLRKALPKPGVKDDPELAPAAHKRFAALKKDVRTIAADQVTRLETAMVTGRRWTPEEFRAYFAGHPLIWHIARRLVWLAGDRAFRIAEDRTLADVEDAAFTLPDAAEVGIAHPLHLGGRLGAWAEVFADYEITQPFPQLGRAVHALADGERGSSRLARFEGVTVPTGKVLGLTRHGWERGAPQDNGIEHEISLRVAGGRWVVIDLDPGIAVGAIDVFPEQTLRRVMIGTRSFAFGSEEGDRRFGELDSVTASELLATLTDLSTK
ncbi:DUF4132 domain-containing protein [Actinomadura rugatobispora]|uniref:DUF4132 domain-containing protein n=1 Tax=Actinomadura rugatobispora TaxID=1994 RepID=A0ABW1A368_9ACTN